MLSGPNIAALREILTFSAFPVIASGGISTIETCSSSIARPSS